jgi:hypothetical protein
MVKRLKGMRFFKDPTGKCGSRYVILQGSNVKYWFKDAGGWQKWLNAGSTAEEMATLHHPQEIGALEVLVVCGAWDGSKK